jgi:tripartite ATP-independent transporter DctP family solute receptor
MQSSKMEPTPFVPEGIDVEKRFLILQWRDHQLGGSTMMKLSAVVLAGLVATLWLGSSQGNAQDKTVLKLGNVQAPGMPVQTGLKRFADLVRERTGGAVEIEIFPASQLGSEQEIIEGVQLGTIHMFEGSAGSLGRFLPKLEAMACPFLWESTDSMVKAVRGPIGQQLSEELLKARGVRLLDMGWVFGVRHLTTTKTPVRKPEDANGLKIRVQPDAIYLATVRAMGASPTPIDAKEVYTSVQTGVVDGQENPINNIWQRKFHEVQKYLMLTGHITQNQVVVINEAAFQKLKPEHRDVLVKAAYEAGDFQNGLIETAEKQDLDSLKKGGMEVIEPDVAAFRKAADGVCRDAAYEQKWGKGFYDSLIAAQK